MAIDWSVVGRLHVEEACRHYDRGDRQPKRWARSTFLLLNERRYPAKFIRGWAYELATGEALDPSKDFSGGLETAKFFRKLGFKVEHYRGSGKPEKSCENAVGVSPKKKRPRKEKPVAEIIFKPTGRVTPPDQRAYLLELLRRRFGEVQMEKTFSWLRVPSSDAMDGSIKAIYEQLFRVRGYSDFAQAGTALKCDFYMPRQGVILEYDERQHFTKQRAVALKSYPEDVKLGFDRHAWIAVSERVQAQDGNPVYRDEQRAFYDSLRDLLPTQHGMVTVRIQHGVEDWSLPAAYESLRNRLRDSGADVGENPDDENAFFSDDWCGFEWTEWLPLDSDEGFRSLPTSSGLYRVRPRGRRELAWIGQTGNLRVRLQTLRNQAYAEQMPFNDPHTAAANIWVLRVEEKLSFECSAASLESEERQRRAYEDMLLWLYRMERGESTLCNHGRFHKRYLKSGSRVSGRRGGRLPSEKTNHASGPSARPLSAHDRKPQDRRWMGIEWSELFGLKQTRPYEFPSKTALYKILDSSSQTLLYVGETRNLRNRVRSHSRSDWGDYDPVLAFHLLPEDTKDYQRREMETDLLGGYFAMCGTPPVFQYKRHH